MTVSILRLQMQMPRVKMHVFWCISASSDSNFYAFLRPLSRLFREQFFKGGALASYQHVATAQWKHSRVVPLLPWDTCDPLNVCRLPGGHSADSKITPETDF
mmetsp:Transcript_9201/g.17955  ORF Transcript_9201/g.17955 Transcript_9201/m.17955 type:complete len:102 (+) Transcript_9201:429-734(+)